MTGVDTNVLVRYLTQDDPAQARRVDAAVAQALEEGSRLYVDAIVLCELVWVLGGAYRLGRTPIAGALEKLLSTALFSFEDRELLRHAVDAYHVRSRAAGPHRVRGAVSSNIDTRPALATSPPSA